MNERIITIRIKAKSYNISLICAYGPTEEKDDMVTDAFYANMENVYDKCPAHYEKIVLGDFHTNHSKEGTFRPTVQPPREYYLQWYEADRFVRDA